MKFKLLIAVAAISTLASCKKDKQDDAGKLGEIQGSC